MSDGKGDKEQLRTRNDERESKTKDKQWKHTKRSE